MKKLLLGLLFISALSARVLEIHEMKAIFKGINQAVIKENRKNDIHDFYTLAIHMGRNVQGNYDFAETLIEMSRSGYGWWGGFDYTKVANANTLRATKGTLEVIGALADSNVYQVHGYSNLTPQEAAALKAHYGVILGYCTPDESNNPVAPVSGPHYNQFVGYWFDAKGDAILGCTTTDSGHWEDPAVLPPSVAATEKSKPVVKKVSDYGFKDSFGKARTEKISPSQRVWGLTRQPEPLLAVYAPSPEESTMLAEIKRKIANGENIPIGSNTSDDSSEGYVDLEAARKGYLSVLCFLTQNIALVNQKAIFGSAMEAGQIDVIKFIYDDKSTSGFEDSPRWDISITITACLSILSGFEKDIDKILKGRLGTGEYFLETLRNELLDSNKSPKEIARTIGALKNVLSEFEPYIKNLGDDITKTKIQEKYFIIKYLTNPQSPLKAKLVNLHESKLRQLEDIDSKWQMLQDFLPKANALILKANARIRQAEPLFPAR